MSSGARRARGQGPVESGRAVEVPGQRTGPVAAAFGALAVLGANFLHLADLAAILDPASSIDAFYLARASRPVLEVLRGDPAWGPLYALWLKPLLALSGDPLTAYTLNLYVLSCAVSLLLYVYLVRLSGRCALAAAAALFFLVSDLNVPLLSKVSHFALALVLAGLIAAELAAVPARRTAAACTGVLLASYARPELYPAALALAALSVRQSITSGDRSARTWGGPFAVVTLAAAAAVVLGVPVTRGGGEEDRLFMAFREHFAWNWSRWHGTGRSLAAMWREAFGDAESLRQAIGANPIAFARHLLDNVLGTLAFLATAAWNHYPLLAVPVWPRLVRLENVLAGAVVFSSLGLVLLRATFRRRVCERHARLLAPYALIGGSSLAAAAAIYPLPSYLLPAAVLLLIAAAIALAAVLPDPPPRSARVMALATLGCWIAVPRPFILPSAYVVPGAPFKARLTVSRTIADAVAAIRSLPLARPVHVLTLNDGIGELLGAGFEEIKAWKKGDLPLADYVREQHVDLIVTTDPGRKSFVLADPFWELVQNDPQAAGFAALPGSVPGAARLWIRKDLLAK